MPTLSFETRVTGDLAVITLNGELDVAGTALIEHELSRIVTDHAPSGIVLDLSKLDFMDSTGLRAIVLSDARAQSEGWRLTLVRGRDDVHRVFEITRMTDRLRFVDTADEVTG